MIEERGNNIDVFKTLLKEGNEAAVPMTLRRVKVSAVDWEAKTMDAIDLVDDLEHYDIRLGMGAIFIRPAIDTLCLIALIGKEVVDTILIAAAEIEQIEITDKTGFKVDLNEGKMTINGDAFGGIVNAKELKQQVDKNTALLQRMQQVFSAWTPVPSDGGAALKAQVTQFTSMPRADLSNIENKNISHG
jgi:hypothetical protein